MEEKIPELTLEPETAKAAAAEPFAAPKTEVRPELSLEETAAAPEAGPDMSQLTEKEQQAVLEFVKKIDLNNTNLILQYGAGAEKNIADFSQGALDSVRTKDLGEVGDMITGLVKELKGFNPAEEKGFRPFRKAAGNIQAMKTKYNKVEANVDQIAAQLQNHQLTLLKDVALLDQMYEKNLEYYKQVTMYILAGQKKLAEEKAATLVELRSRAQTSGLPEDAQAVNDFEDKLNRFEKKLHDLELTRVICLQMAPQIRLVQNNDTMMSEKIQSSLMHTIPLWKSQMVLALGIQHSKEAVEAQRAVSDMTNQLLKKNAELLHTASVETARESERAIVDIETLQHTNQELIATLDEVLQIQTEGRQKRAQAEGELRRIEGELRQKLLTVRP